MAILSRLARSLQKESIMSTPDFPHDQTGHPEVSGPQAGVEARRRLLRAGLSAGPVLMAVKSRSVLAAGGCTSASAFASLNAAQNAGIALSHCPAARTTSRLKSPAKLAESSSAFQKASEFGQSSTNRYFYTPEKFTFQTTQGKNKGGQPQFKQPAVKGSLEFHRLGDTSNPTVLEVLRGQNELAKLLAATVLNKEQGLDDDNILPDANTCRQIWANQGAWTPPGSSKAWTQAETIGWLKYVYGA